MKTEFVSLASHQLRTPLTSIKWYSELLLDDVKKIKDEQREYVSEIMDASERMVELVNSLLNVSRLELGTFAIEPVPADLLKVIDVAVREQEPTFKEKKQAFTYNRPASLPEMQLDKKITHIVVQNLLSNAHKYSPEGSKVVLEVKKVTQGKESFVDISCADNGYGIPKRQQASIFKKLFRADNIRSLDVEGTGLGLYIIKTVVEAAGCSISFESEENKGTTFTVRIPLKGMTPRSGTRALSQSME